MGGELGERERGGTVRREQTTSAARRSPSPTVTLAALEAAKREQMAQKPGFDRPTCRHLPDFEPEKV